MTDRSPHVLLLFLDGLGIGKKDEKYNPFLVADMPVIKKLMGGVMPTLRKDHRNGAQMTFKPIKATLGIPGLPQSGTGQAALLTGVNTAQIIGKHYGPHLYSTLKPIVAEQNIFRKLQIFGQNVLYANAFPQQYFDYLKSPRYRTTAIAYAWLSTGNKLNDSDSLRKSQSLSADITNERWHKLGYPDMPTMTFHEAGKRLVKLTEIFNFVLFEYYFTDHAGHSQSMKEAVGVLQKLDGLLEGILDSLDHKSMLLLLTSDHGNLEDLSTKSHTRNPVPLLAIGKNHKRFAANVKEITDVTPAIIDLLS